MVDEDTLAEHTRLAANAVAAVLQPLGYEPFDPEVGIILRSMLLAHEEAAEMAPRPDRTKSRVN